MKKLLFGTAGIPVSAKERSSVAGIQKVKELDLDCMELEFVRGVHMSESSAEMVSKEAKKQEIVLTAHAPYYINLNSDDEKKIAASRQRILKTARIAKMCGAVSVTFHAAYYLKQEPDKVYEVVLKQLKKIVNTLKKEDNNILIRPELTGKPTQWGDIDELIRVSKDLEQVLPCIDFAHYHARHNGEYNSYKGFRRLLEKLEKGLGRDALNNMHIHVSGIEYSEKGEKKHRNIKDSDINHSQLLKTWKEYKIKGVVISESPNIEGDAEFLKKSYDKINLQKSQGQ